MSNLIVPININIYLVVHGMSHKKTNTCIYLNGLYTCTIKVFKQEQKQGRFKIYDINLTYHLELILKVTNQVKLVPRLYVE